MSTPAASQLRTTCASAHRRAVTVRAVRERNAELFGVFAWMNGRMDELCARYTEAELAVIADFLQRSSAAGRDSAAELSPD